MRSVLACCHTMRNSLIAIALLATAATSANAAHAHDCTCKYQGGDVAQGQTVCLKTSTGSSLARCDMVLNNSSWKMLDEPCDVKTSGRVIRPPDKQS